MSKPLERASAYLINEGGVTIWDLEGMAIDLMACIKIAKISREEVHRKMDELYNTVEAGINFPTEGTA